MNREQLMEYLGAVCDAENALYACNEAIGQLNWKLQQVFMPNPPCMPEKAAPDVPHVEEHKVKGSCAIMVVGAVAGLVIGLEISTNMESFSVGLGFVLTFLIGPLVGAFLPMGILELCAKAKTDAEWEHARQSAVSYADYTYERAKEKYQRDMAVYERSKQVAAAVRKEIENAIQTNRFVAERIKGELQQLYDRNIIHASFRNMIAANQIREYIDMGICDGLEGSNGAYAQYLLDVRTDRICNSIEDLKKNMLNALNQIALTQSMMLSEMRRTNENLTSIQSSIDQGIASIQQQINRAQQSAETQLGRIDAQFAEMNGQVAEMRRALSASAHNQYVALRETNVRRYLKKYQLDANELKR